MTKSKARQKFDDAMAALVQVPKAELDEARAEQQKASKNRRKQRKKKPKR